VFGQPVNSDESSNRLGPEFLAGATISNAGSRTGASSMARASEGGHPSCLSSAVKLPSAFAAAGLSQSDRVKE
jgi:hypothetical protein